MTTIRSLAYFIVITWLIRIFNGTSFNANCGTRFGLANIMWSASVDIIKGNNGKFIVAQHTSKQDGSFDPDKQKFDDIRSLVGDFDKFRRMNATKTSQL